MVREIDVPVTVIIPVLNEVGHLEYALESLFQNGYDLDLLEFILIDGGSTDGTLDLLNEIQKTIDVNLVILHNPQGRTPFGLNIGILAAKNEVIVRADAHAIYQKEYISRSVSALVSGLGDNVGGRIIAKESTSIFSCALARVLNTPFGNGGASYRRDSIPKLVDTVWCGCWYKQTLLAVGMFDQNWATNQDAELNARLIESGRRVYCDPRIKAELTVRNTYRDMIKQYYSYGKGRYKTLKRHPKMLKVRQILPILFVLGFIALAFTHLPLFLLGTASLVIAFVVNGGFLFGVYGWSIPIVLGMNLAWVSGFFCSLFTSLKTEKDNV